ncbi:MAG: DUF1080 domain-containing protein [Pirellulales bacterium]|nr:DUF1080 domain-containing protein [Pirellulales bacterium]
MPLALPVLAVVLALANTTPQPAYADEPAGLALFADNSFVGWDYGAVDNVAGEPAGWSMKARQLSGSEGAAPLLSGFTFGDFELRLAWQVSPGGSCKMLLPVTSKPAADVPDRYASPRWELTLREGDSCGTLVDNWGVHAAGGAVAASDGKPHATVLRRAGNKFALAVDGHQLYEIEIRPELRFGLGLEAAAGQVRIDDLRLSEPDGEPLIKPGEFAGWWSPRGMRAWKWEGDELVCRGSGGDYLRTEREWENFTLTFDYKLGQRGNSGIGIRTPREGWPSGDGIELQLYDELPDAPLNRHSTMALYGNLEPLARGDRRDEWNHAVVRAEGYVVSAWVNGRLVQHGNTWRLSELKYRHLKGWIGLQDHGGRVRFRNVRATELPAGRGPASWYAKRPEPAALVVLDRLMNPLRAADDDGIRTLVERHAAESTTGAGEVVVAHFTGPGAVTTIVVPDPNEQLAWHFDSEAQPRLRATAAELIHKVPCVDHEMWPPVVWVPFERELKIVRPPITASAEAPRAAGEYRVEAASLPSSLPVRSWSADRVDVPRGLLSACSYRFHQMDSGRLRELSPAMAHASPKRRLNPGERAEVLNVPGAGVAQWLSLAAPASALASDDLSIEVTVDGEAQPALAAPARYWFPGVAARKGWHNFVITSDEVLLSGDIYTNRLAIPFGGGLQVALVNRGAKALDRLSVSMSIIAADNPLLADGLPKRRLRGLFASQSSASAGAPGTATGSFASIALEGSARLVGIVCQSAEDAMPRVATLAIDGQPQPAWTGYPLADAPAGGAAGPLFQPLGGRAAGVAWHHALLAPIDCQRSLTLAIEPRPASSWLLYYVEP